MQSRAMDFQASKFVSSLSSPSMEGNMINSLLLSHDPLGRHFDSMTLLRVAKTIMFHASALQENHYFGDGKDVGKIEMIGLKEPIKCAIYKILSQMARSGEGEDLQKKTMFLFDLLGEYRWEEKVVLAITAFAVRSYNLTPIATWELTSLVILLSRICKQLNQQVELCNQMMENKLYQKLINLFEETQADGNQEVLQMLLGLHEEFPLQKHLSKEKLGVNELMNKVVILLISKPDLLPKETTLFIVQQTTDHPHTASSEGSFEVIWIPISLSGSWTDAEKIHTQLLSNSLPFYSMRKPWLLNSAIVKFIKQKWKFADEPVMAALDSNGRLLNSNAFNMVSIWGGRAYPFSVLREKELWLEQNWTIQLLINGIDPLLTKWVEEGRIVCIYGSCSLKWIREFTDRMKEIENEVVQIEIVYVGGPNPGQNIKTIKGIVDAEQISRSLSFMQICFFWLRMESIRTSKLRLHNQYDQIIEKVSEMMNIGEENEDGWAVIGSGSCSDAVKLQGSKQIECLNLFSKWKENVGKFGFLGALKTAIDPPLLSGPCGHLKVVSYREEVENMPVVCEKCNRIMEKFVVYE